MTDSKERAERRTVRRVTVLRWLTGLLKDEAEAADGKWANESDRARAVARTSMLAKMVDGFAREELP